MEPVSASARHFPSAFDGPPAARTFVRRRRGAAQQARARMFQARSTVCRSTTAGDAVLSSAPVTTGLPPPIATRRVHEPPGPSVIGQKRASAAPVLDTDTV